MDSKDNLSGPLFSSGQCWVEQRKFMFQQMSNLGMGKQDTMTDIINQEVAILCDSLAEKAAATVETRTKGLTINYIFMTAVNNVVCRIITGKRTLQSDPQLKVLTKNVWDFFRVMERGSILNVLQVNSWLISRLSQIFKVENLIDICEQMLNMFRQEVKESGTADPDGNYIDRFLAEIESADPASSFHGNDGQIHLIGSSV